MAMIDVTFDKVVTTDTSASSLVVGGATPTSTTGTGGINAGSVVAATFTGQLLAPAGIAVDGATAGTHGIQFPNSGATPSSTAHNLYSPDGATVWFNGVQLATGSAVSGTAGQLAKFTAASTLGDSLTSESGTTQTLLGQYKVQSGVTPGLLLGADANARTLTNSTEKRGILATPHYTNAQNPVAGMFVDSAAGNSNIYVGGGITGMNAATAVNIYTGATTTTDIGTQRIYVGAGVRIGSSATDPGTGQLYVEGATTLASTLLVSGVLSAGSGPTTLTNATGIILNAATTATSANTASAIVARDGSGNFSAGTITATVTGTATNATNVGITDDNATAASMNVAWVTSNTGNLPVKVSSAKLTFNPSSGVITATGGVTTVAMIGDTLTGSRTPGAGLTLNGGDLGSNNAVITLLAGVTTVSRSLVVGTGAVTIAGTNGKLASFSATNYTDDFINQSVKTASTPSFGSVTVTGSSAPANGIFLPAANNVGIATNSAEVARVLSTGQVVLGATAAPNSGYFSVVASALTYNLITLKTTNDTVGVNFQNFVNSSGTEIGSISRAGASSIAFNTTSDARLKKSLGLFTDVKSILSVPVRRYLWKGTKNRDIGLFAQELHKRAPECVTVGGRNPKLKPWKIDHGKLTIRLLALAQQQQRRIDALESKA